MIRAVLCDVEGTLLVDGASVPGAAEALGVLAARGIALRCVTNTTTRPRSAVARELLAAGLAVPEEHVFGALRAGRDHLVAAGIGRAFLLVTERAREDFEGIVNDPERGAAVVVGDLAGGFTAELLQQAFDRLLEGASLVALARNRYYRKGGRLLLDAGPYVAALEYATGVSATLVGKPAPGFFLRALAGTGAAPEETLVVGDDLVADVGGARAAGMRGVLVRTGKFREEDLARAAHPPDAMLASVAGLPALL